MTADVCACGTVKPPTYDSNWNALWHLGCAERAAMVAEADAIRFDACRFAPYGGPAGFKVTPKMQAEIEETFTPSKPVIQDGSEPF